MILKNKNLIFATFISLLGVSYALASSDPASSKPVTEHEPDLSRVYSLIERLEGETDPTGIKYDLESLFTTTEAIIRRQVPGEQYESHERLFERIWEVVPSKLEALRKVGNVLGLEAINSLEQEFVSLRDLYKEYRDFTFGGKLPSR